MKIWGEVPKVAGIYAHNKNVKKLEVTSNIASKKDVVSISGSAKDYQIAMKAIKDVPNIRQDKVNNLVDKYESGNYDINGKDTADMIIKSMLNSKVLM